MRVVLRLGLVAVAAGLLGLMAGHWYRAWRAGVEAPAAAVPQGVRPARPGDALPELTLPDLDGRPVRLDTLAPGRPLLLNVWASWCGPCVEEMPELERFAREQGDAGVQVVGLALDSPEAVRDFLRRVPVGYPILLDQPGPADASVWLGNTRGLLPYTVLVGADRRIVRQKLGPFAPGEVDRWARP